jgi:hypothetical protein
MLDVMPQATTICIPISTLRELENGDSRQNQSPAPRGVRVVGDQIARPGLRTLALIWEFLCRCREATDVAASAGRDDIGGESGPGNARFANCGMYQ